MGTLATIERGTTEYLARIVEQGKEARYFVPSPGVYYVSPYMLQHAVRATYPDVTFVDEATFNQAVEKEERQESTSTGDAQKLLDSWGLKQSPDPIARS